MTKKRWLMLVVSLLAIGGSSYSLWNFYKENHPTDLRPPMKVAAPRVRSAADESKYDAEDAALQACLNSPSRWVELPKSAMAAYNDASGRLWFISHGLFASDDYKRSIERAAQGKSRMIRGGRLLLLDSKGRYWGFGDGRGELLCFDGQRWLEPRTAPPVELPEPKSDRKPTMVPNQRFADMALEDSRGNIYFVSSAFKSGVLHRFGPDGQWTSIPFSDSEPVRDVSRLIELSGERIAILPSLTTLQSNQIGRVRRDHEQGKPSAPRTDLPAARIWDGKSWTTFRPTDDPAKDRWVSRVVGLPDGAIVVFYQNGTVDLHWPNMTDEYVRSQASSVMAGLEATDPAQRASSLAELIKLGPPALPIIESASKNEESVPPQTRSMLRMASTTIKSNAVLVKEGKGESAILGGRYQAEWIAYVCTSPRGRVHLYANDCFDTLTLRKLGSSMLTIEPDGRWHATPFAPDSKEFWLTAAMDTSYRDVGGNIYLGDSVYQLGDSVTRQSIKRAGLNVYNIWAADHFNGTQIVYGGANGGILCNLTKSDTTTPMQYIDHDSLQTSQDATSAWTWSTTVARILPDGKVEPIELPHPKLQVQSLWALTDSAAIIWLKPAKPSAELMGPIYYLYIDGEWIGGNSMTMADLIDSEPAAFAKVADTRSRHRVVANPSYFFSVSSDAGKGVWYHGADAYAVFNKENTRYAYQQVSQLKYFDGEKWNNAWEPFKEDLAAYKKAKADDEAERGVTPVEPRTYPIETDYWKVLGTVDRGHGLIVYDQDRKHSWLVSFENQKMQRAMIPGSEGVVPTKLFSTESGPAWLNCRAGGATKAFRYSEGKMAPIDLPGEIIGVDRSGQIWTKDGDTLWTALGEKRASCKVAGFTEKMAFFGAPNQQKWLAVTSDLFRIKVSEDFKSIDAQSVLKWPISLNDFNLFGDNAGGVWMRGDSGKVGRLTFEN